MWQGRTAGRGGGREGRGTEGGEGGRRGGGKEGREGEGGRGKEREGEGEEGGKREGRGEGGEVEGGRRGGKERGRGRKRRGYDMCGGQISIRYRTFYFCLLKEDNLDIYNGQKILPNVFIIPDSMLCE